MKINKAWLKQFNPCSNRWRNYLKHYPKWEGTLCDFLQLENISIEDKLWVIGRKYKHLEKLQRQFALQCATRAVDDCNSQEVKDYLSLVILIYESSDLSLLDSKEYRAADSEAYWAARGTAYSEAYSEVYWAAYSEAYWAAYAAADSAAHAAADSAAERDIQINMAAALAEEMGL